MNIDTSKLSLNVGLKYNDNVILGKENVNDFITNNIKEFSDLYVNKIDNSSMLYGYNENQNPIKIGYEKDEIQRIIMLTEPVHYVRFKAIISYDGHLYNGFQIQNNLPTIQGALSKVVTNVNGYDTLVQGCSRTDTGVHANYFVIHFDSTRDISASRWLELFNHQLDSDILVHKVIKTHPLFHARYDVLRKRYVYKIKLNEIDPFKVNYEWNCREFDIQIMKDNLKQLIGTHDFTSFCKGNPNDSVRTIYDAQLIQNKDNIQLVFEGNGFLRYMIRIIVNTLYLQAQKKLLLTINEIIQEKSRTHTKNMAPAVGLYLDKIYY